jgi:hypothetical protein
MWINSVSAMYTFSATIKSFRIDTDQAVADELFSAENGVNCRCYLKRIRLDDITSRACAKGLSHYLWSTLQSYENDLRCGGDTVDLSSGLNPIQLRKANVQQHYFRLQLFRAPNSLPSIRYFGDENEIRTLLKECTNKITEWLEIVGDEDAY